MNVLALLLNRAVARVRGRRTFAAVLLAAAVLSLAAAPAAMAMQPPVEAAAEVATHAGGEASLILPDLGQAEFMGVNGRTLLMLGLGVCLLGLVFGLVVYQQLKALPVHGSMREISELIYETCKTYLLQQGKFLAILELFIGIIIIIYFGFLQHFEPARVVDHPRLQRARHRRQLRRGLVRDPDQHVRELADRVREPARGRRSRRSRFR